MSARRRGHGEGSIFQLPDGRWRGQVYIGYGDGRRRSRVTTRRTRREAAEWLHRIREDYRSGVVAPGTITLREWSETYLRDVARNRVKPSTYRNYERDFALYINPTLGRVRLNRLEPAQVSQLYERKLAEGLSPTSVRLIHATLRRALTVAMRWGLIGRNVALMVDPPRQSQHPVEPLSLAEARALLDAAKGDRMEARWVLGLSLGLRQGEALGLWWQDVDLTSGVLRVSRQLVRRQRPGESLAFADLKTARSRRVLALPAPLVGLLQNHHERQEREKNLPPAMSAGWSDARVVFATPKGSA